MSGRRTPKVFDVNFKSKEEVQRTGLVIEGQILSLFVDKGRLEALTCKSSIKLGLPGADVQAFNKELGVKAAAKS